MTLFFVLVGLFTGNPMWLVAALVYYLMMDD